jgi:hypothetical protein
MMFIELFAPHGALSADQRRRVALRLGSLREFAPAEEVHAGTATVFGAMFHVVVHEPRVWVAADQLVEPDAPAVYVVRVFVPGPWRKDMSETIVSHVTKALAEVDDDGERPYREPVVQVHVLGVPEGGFGLYGQVKTSTQLVELMSEPYEADFAAGKALKDPLCGVIVPLNDTTVTLELDDTLYGFCCAGCRDEFVEKRRKAATA